MDQCKCVRETREGKATDLSLCPWCGCDAVRKPDREYADWGCGSFKHGPEPYQSTDCKLNVAEATLVLADLSLCTQTQAVADLKAGVAAREERCAVLVDCLQQVEADLTCPVGGPFTLTLNMVRQVLRTPDLAAARLLAAGAFRDAYQAYNEHIEECNDCCCYDPCEDGDRLRLALGEAEDACRATKEAKEKADE